MRAILRSMINKMFYANAKPLGRWQLEYCSKKMNRKIDMSNEDHCGPCGQYIVNKIETNKLAIDKAIKKK
jgi:hypothetical protein